MLEVFVEFENQFGRLSARDQAILVPDKAVVFLKAVDIQDRKDLGLFLEYVTTEGGLTNTWGNFWDIMAQYTKRRQWLREKEKRDPEPAQRSRGGVENHQQ